MSNFQKFHELRAKLAQPARAAALRNAGGRNGQKWAITICFLLSLALLFVGRLSPERTQSIEAGSLDAFSPILVVLSSPVESVTNLVANVNSLLLARQRNVELEAQLMELRDVRAKNFQLTAENEELRRLVNAPKRVDLSYISARAIGDGRLPWRQSLIINRGKTDGIKNNQLILMDGIVVGRVAELGLTSARALLLTDPASRVPVRVGSDKQRAILRGDATLFPQLLYLRKEAQIENGDEVVTSGFGGQIPPGVPVGRVVLSADAPPQVQLYADVNSVDYVHIVDYRLQNEEGFVSRSGAPLKFDE